jgi:NADH-ubiquinone oxidoreductase chain 4
LAGVLLKSGGYGLLRVFPVLVKFGFRFGVVWISLSLVGGLSVSLFCIRQTDLKSLIAYSSVAHISMVIGGIITLSYWGVCRYFALMVAHSLWHCVYFSTYVPRFRKNQMPPSSG